MPPISYPPETYNGEHVRFVTGSSGEILGVAKPNTNLDLATNLGNIVTAQTNPVTGGIELLTVGGVKLGAISSITYNTNGTINTYIRNTITWTCAYDSAGRLSTETAAGVIGTVKTYTYDATTGLLSVLTVV